MSRSNEGGHLRRVAVPKATAEGNPAILKLLADRTPLGHSCNISRYEEEPVMRARIALHDLWLLTQGIRERYFCVRGSKPSRAHVQEYAKIVCEHVERLNKLITSRRRELRSIAREQFAWPVLKSLHPAFSQDERIILRNLQVGRAVGRFLDSGCKWKQQGGIACLVGLLLNWVDRARRARSRKQVPN